MLRDGDRRVIGGYVLEGRLGMGGMGTVYLGRSPSGRQVAVKVIHQQFVGDPKFTARFRQEVAAARRVSGAFTAPVVDADPDAVPPWMATQYVDAETLGERVRRQGPLCGEALIELAIGLAEALRDIHRVGMVHRDLKPANVLIGKNGPLVIDFGIARALEGSELLTQTGQLVGTPPFMAPEQFLAPREVGPAADIFALASVLLFAATGRGPFDAESPHIVAYQVVHVEPNLEGLGEGLHGIVTRCLSKDPERRPSPAELLALLSQLRAGSGAIRDPSSAEQTPPKGTPPRVLPNATGRRRRRRRTIPLVAVAVAVVCTATPLTVLNLAGENRAAHSSKAPGWRPWQTTLQGYGYLGQPECHDLDGALYCGGGGIPLARLSRADGRMEWRHEGDTPMAVDILGAAGGLLFSQREESNPSLEASLEEYSVTGIEALDSDSGKLRWKKKAIWGRQAFFFGGSTVLDADLDGGVRAYDSRSGRQLWKKKIADGCDYTGTRDAVYALCSDGLYGKGRHDTLVIALSPDEGHTLWTARHNGLTLSLADHSNGVMHFVEAKPAEDLSLSVVALVEFDVPTRKFTRHPLAKPLSTLKVVLSDGTLYAVDEATGSVHAIAMATGRARWSTGTSTDGLSAPAVGDDALYLATATGRVVALDRSSGREMWASPARAGLPDTEANTGAPAPPVLIDETLVATSAGGKVFSFDVNHPPKTT
ncbi:PQQ-binding-like beta-propeller repeat protein [Streptomyces sp. M41]|uniref:serine/threonine-protein kinase n=1 Tax=Streptomyces sp. M41 TaxID=3059412 RepID=UPI00374CC178